MRLNDQIPGCLMAPDIAQILFRHRKRDIDRNDFVDRHERRRIVRADEVALLDLDTSRDSVDRRADRAEAELQLDSLDSGLVSVDRRFAGLRSCANLLISVSGNEFLAQKILVTHGLRFRVLELRTILGQIGLGLIELRDERSRVELEEHGTALDGVPFLESHGNDLAVDARADRDRCVRLDVADRGELERNRLLNDRRRGDRDGRRTFRCGGA